MELVESTRAWLGPYLSAGSCGSLLRQLGCRMTDTQKHGATFAALLNHKPSTCLDTSVTEMKRHAHVRKHRDSFA